MVDRSSQKLVVQIDREMCVCLPIFILTLFKHIILLPLGYCHCLLLDITYIQLLRFHHAQYQENKYLCLNKVSFNQLQHRKNRHNNNHEDDGTCVWLYAYTNVGWETIHSNKNSLHYLCLVKSALRMPMASLRMRINQDQNNELGSI